MLRLLSQLLEGTVTSLEIFALTLLFAVPLALPVALGRMSRRRWISVPIRVYVLVTRGTPLLLQILFVYFGPYYLFRLQTGPGYRFPAVIIAFALNYAAYFAEIYRGGIQDIPRGQWEAAKVLGFTRSDTLFRIVLPQVVKRILPASANEVTTLVKDTALAFTIGISEMFRFAQNASQRAFSVVPIFVAGGFYLVMCAVVDEAFRRGERRLAYYR